ncbi:MAG: carboxypeptidase regulatory-like domain-containing protein [Armatimonadota bacterium]
MPLGLLASTAAVVARDAEEGSVLPPAAPRSDSAAAAPPADPAAPALKVKKGLQVALLGVGAEPYTWLKPGRLPKTFLTNGAEGLDLRAEAKLAGPADLLKRVVWEILPPAGFQVPAGTVLTGPRLSLRLQRPGGNPTGQGEPLILTVTARIPDGDSEYRESVTVMQDLRDRLRQEYVDLARSWVPARADLMDETEFQRRFGKKYPGVAFSEINFSRIPGRGEERYPVVLAAEELVSSLHRMEKIYGRELIVSSGFRNPVRQVEVHGSVAESHHQYGRAADLYVVPDSAPPKTGRDVAWPNDWLRLAAAAVRGGGAWIEPMEVCNVNTAGCHVHVDVRPSGARSQVVRVNGTVQDEAGRPIVGATVKLAGMPATTDERGAYTLKHVLTPRQYELVVEAAGRGEIKQTVNVSGETLTASIRVPSNPQPFLVARLAGAELASRGGTVQIAVRNAGGSAARQLELETAAMHEQPRPLPEMSPEELPALQPGEEVMVNVEVPEATLAASALKGSRLPLQLRLSYRTPDGVPRAQRLPLEVALRQSKPAQASEKKSSGPEAGTLAGGAVAGGVAAAAAAATAKRRSAKKEAPAEPEKPAAEAESSILPENVTAPQPE